MITAIIQARMSSTRLPGKVMMKLCGKSLLEHIIERVSFSSHISQVVVSSTTNPADDPLIDWLDKKGIPFFRGSETDVLNRYYETAKQFKAPHIARITSDDPFKDPGVIDSVANLYFGQSLDFAYNNNPPSFAEGLDTEIFSFDALSRAQSNAIDPFEREHVTQYFYRNPALFKQANLLSPIDYSNLRWTIDTKEDFLMAHTVYKHLYKSDKLFTANDILNLIKSNPEIPLINQRVERSAMYKK